ncbi:MAG: Bestrophin, RFP-TM, chloride channel-domain-containing protein [Linnemannia elongata]|nr:MAG: Bestrophin, RFP-TM, chloride channel-domain-containing protein [Linnemannia elongata]
MARKYGTTVYVNAKWRMMLRLKGTVILQIWWHILLVGIYSTIVFLISKYTEWKMLYTLNLVSVMGMVVSLLLVFRTNTAYDRYWEGRRLWSQMTLCIRNLTRGIWVCVAETETRDLLEKKSAINLLVAFAFATKHYLREEYGYDYDDMKDLLTHIPKYSIPTSVEPMDWRMDIPTTPLESLTPQQQQPQQPQSSQLSGSATNIGRASGTFGGARARRQSRAQALAFDFLTPTNIPVELSYYIGSYIKTCSNKGKVDPATLTMMNNALVSMIDCLTGFERILRTPIPLAYSIHLHHATWIYLLALPFQLVSNMKELMIPATMLAAFTLLGILGIGYEIENPFNDDYNDLPLDDFCKVIQAEVDSMVATRAPVPADWIFSENNYPLAQSNLSAKELSALSLDEIHAMMEAENPHYGAGERAQARRSVQLQYSRSVSGNQKGPAPPASPTSPTTPTIRFHAPGEPLRKVLSSSSEKQSRTSV